MNEFQTLMDSFRTMQSRQDVPYETFFEGMPNEGMVDHFLAEIRTEPVSEQAEFISQLSVYRPGCEDRLLELAESSDLTAAVYANRGLMNTSSFEKGLNFLVDATKLRLVDEEMEKGDWPFHFLIDLITEIDNPMILRRLEKLADEVSQGNNAIEKNLQRLNNLIALMKKSDSKF